MDAIKLIEERNRMCNFHYHAGECCECPAKDFECNSLLDMGDDYRIVSVVEEWSAAHPRKTRQSVFLEQFPNVELDRNRIINISPCKVDPKQYPFNGKNCRKFQRCGECLREFWMQEVE